MICDTPSIPNIMPVEKWKLSEFNRCYCYNRNGIVYTYVFHERKSTPLAWTPENKKLALEYLRERIEVHLGIKTKSKKLSHLLNDYTTNKLPQLAPISQERITYTFKWLLDIPNYDLEQTAEIKTALLKRMADRGIVKGERTKDALSKGTIIKYLNYLKAFFNYGIENNYMQFNPINKSQIPKMEKKPILAFKPQEIESVLEYLKDVNKPTYNVVFFTRFMGTRINETLSLTWDKIDFANGTLEIKRKGGYWQVLPFDNFPELKAFLENLEKTEDRVFPISSQKAGEHFKKALKHLGIEKDLSFHGIRKMRENELIKIYKNDITLVARLIGHTVAIQQKHYFEILTPEEIRDGLNVKIPKVENDK